ncbi:hypothetical protein ACU63Y_07970 [Klebsiella aerogenes]
MISEKVKCPICGNEAIASKHKLLSQATGNLVPSHVYTCDNDGWFSLSESVNNLVTNAPSAETVEKLKNIVSRTYFPADLWPAEPRPIESLD